MKRATLVLTVICAISTFAAAQTSPDPYASLSAEEKAVLKPGIERYVHDQLKQLGRSLGNPGSDERFEK
jgi:hypothetical protein